MLGSGCLASAQVRILSGHMGAQMACGLPLYQYNQVSAGVSLFMMHYHGNIPMLQVQDKVSFLVNNLTRDNLDAKAEELKKALKPEMWPWFCNYMVIRRVAQEANHQNLYLQVGLQSQCSVPSHAPNSL